MARSKEERERRALEAKERAETRRLARASAKAAGEGGGGGDGGRGGAGGGRRRDADRPPPEENAPAVPPPSSPGGGNRNASVPLTSLPIDALARVMRYLPAREYGAVSLTCVRLRGALLGGTECRVVHLSSRLARREDGGGKRSACGSMCPIGGLSLCGGRREAMEILDRSLAGGGGGGTGRLVAMGGSPPSSGDEYPGYARFVEEAALGHSAMQRSRYGTFPAHLQGRFASCSPEHSLLRLGGGGDTPSGPGGSGVSSWGVGKRGQLGRGTRDDAEMPKLLPGGIGWGVRIVQVSAGGGLVRVAHSLLLTSTGRVLSFGQNSYGQLGHGYDPGNVLGDCLRPRYVDALKNVKCMCVSAGELHSGAVTVDGDVYTWGEGFCGQLGLGDRRPHLLPEQVTLGGLGDECVSNMSCGCRHTLVTTEEGEVFSWGLGKFGVLGRSYTDFTYQTDVGMVVPEGEEGYAQGGAAVRPAPVLAAPLVAAVAAEANHGEGIGGLIESLEALNLVRGSLANLVMHFSLVDMLDLTRKLYIRQTLDDPSDQCYPKVIDSLKGFRAVGVSAGHRHSLVLDERGGLFSFGSGASGALGHGDQIGQ